MTRYCTAVQWDWKKSWSAAHLCCGNEDVIYTHRLISQFLFVSYSITVGSDVSNIYLLGLFSLFPELDNCVNQGHHYKTRKETDGDWTLLTVGAWDQLMSYSRFSLDLARNWNSWDLSPKFSFFKYCYWFRSPIIKKQWLKALRTLCIFPAKF